MESIYSNTIQIIIACVISTVLFILSITYISKHPQKKTAFLKMVFIAMFILGTVMYCIFHYLAPIQIKGQEQSDFLNSGYNPLFRILYVVLRSVIDVGNMFSGRANTDLFYRLDISKNPVCVILFWTVYVITFYTTASALLLRFGNDLLTWIRITLAKFFGSDVNVIFGVNPDSLLFGKNIADTKGSTLIYVDSFAGDDYELSIKSIGGIFYSDSEALKASPSFLRSIGIKPRKARLKLYAMSSDYDRNIQYAQMMSETLEKANIPPEQTELMLLGTDELKGMIFQSDKNQYGYGNVICFDEFEMSARLLIHEYPLCNAIKFDENGRASEGLEVLIVGFGRMGHEVLRKVIANGQFEGDITQVDIQQEAGNSQENIQFESRNFHATVYDPNFDKHEGFVRSQYPKMFANYNIDFEPQEGRSSHIFQFLKEYAHKLNYIVICLNDRDTARDIAVRMADRLYALGRTINVYTCDTKSVRCYSPNAKKCKTHWVYDSDLLYSGKIDGYAVELNHKYEELYRKSEEQGIVTPIEDWRKCDYFGRMSSRASVDYLIPLIRRVSGESGVLTPEQRENLSMSEHLRWCAFHYTFGFDVMEKEEFLQRVKKRVAEIREHGRSSVKMTKDMDKKLHVCLVGWDELDDISEMENALTHGNADYKENDRRNVDMVMDLMKKS